MYVLSRRWRHLWRSASRTLAFDFALSDAGNDASFISSVTEVLALHRCSNIDKLSIRLNLRSPNVTDLVICDWIQFAVQREVRVLDLEACGYITERESLGYYSPEFRASFDIPGLSSIGYNFPGLEKLLTWPLSIKSCFASLTSLKLVNFNVDDETMDYILSNCSFVERLYLKGGTGLRNLNANSPSLKYLSLGSCWDLKKLKISGPNLVYFEYKGYRDHGTKWVVEFSFENVPLLSEVRTFRCIYDANVYELLVGIFFAFFVGLVRMCKSLKKLTIKTKKQDIKQQMVAIIGGETLKMLEDNLADGAEMVIE
ncbi:OLC1v1038171C1 [Oldenlandia corymbosa var. corymbosa]|uniref:OLC1v1038171C1 n=1 Tax=Oldenlandia corymbosa var. corymbosa TaxID=529605 RepID=A0AAV1D0C8_OLDCO|nr:OLC1v1038171C1 [Oldenlandia corymbosa var. corymbosa]